MSLMATVVDSMVLESLSLIKFFFFSYLSLSSFLVFLKGSPYLLDVHKWCF